MMAEGVTKTENCTPETNVPIKIKHSPIIFYHFGLILSRKKFFLEKIIKNHDFYVK